MSPTVFVGKEQPGKIRTTASSRWIQREIEMVVIGSLSLEVVETVRLIHPLVSVHPSGCCDNTYFAAVSVFGLQCNSVALQLQA